MIGAVPSVTIVEYLVYTRLPLILDDEDVVDGRVGQIGRSAVEGDNGGHSSVDLTLGRRIFRGE